MKRTLAGILTMMVLTVIPSSAAVISVGGSCDLVNAIHAANDNDDAGGLCPPGGSGDDVLVLESSVVLSVLDNEIFGRNGLPVVTSRIVVEGNGYAIVRSSAEGFRHFMVADTGDLTLEDVTLTLGLAGVTSPGQNGGSIYNRGKLTLRDSKINVNSARYGGAIYNAGNARLERTEVWGNTAQGHHGVGGGIASEADAMGRETRLEIIASSISFNFATATSDIGDCHGGGIYADDGPLIIRASTVDDNTASGKDYVQGGGISARTLEMENCTVSANEATSSDGTSSGGGVAAAGTIRNSTFHGNTASRGGALDGVGTLSVWGSLFKSNSSTICWGSVVNEGGSKADLVGCSDISSGLLGLDDTLDNNGGLTETHRLEDWSNAIDIAGSCGLGIDQRGAGRSDDCDAGAFETLPCPLFEMRNQSINFAFTRSVCHTALLGPNLVIESTGSLDMTAGYLVTISEGFSVADGALVRIIAGSP